jgi:hypothetical protein
VQAHPWRYSREHDGCRDIEKRRELAKQEARKERVLGQMADGILSAEDFANLHKSTVKAIADLRERLAFAESEVLDLDSAIEYLTHLLWNTSLVWQTSDLQGKRGFSAECSLEACRMVNQALEHL